jgi:glycerol-3-phosphate acyltransferase PlsY
MGNLLFGFLVGKMLAGRDIRVEGSSNIGARNAGRLYGKKAFVLTFIGDSLKASILIFIGRFLDYSNLILLIGLFFVCLGHIKPIFFKWKGGKGISAFIGGLITIHPSFVIFIIISFFVFYLLYKSFTIPGFFSLFVVCVSFLFLEENIYCSVISTITLLMIIISHQIPFKKFISLV